MNKYNVTLLIGLFAILSSHTAMAYTTIAEECKQRSLYSEFVCEGITEKKEFYDTWYRPPAPFFQIKLDATDLPSPAWISPSFDPTVMGDDSSSRTSSVKDTSETNTESESGLFPSGDTSTCPPNCQ